MLGLVGVVAAGWYLYERPRTYDVAFRGLEVTPPVDYSPGAPEGFPDCTIDMLDMRVDDTGARLDVTFRPKPGIQCAMPVYPVGYWIDATGERFEATKKNPPDGNLLLHGANGVSDAGGIDSACTMKAPFTHFIEIGGEPIRIGAIEKQLDCYGNPNRSRVYATYMLNRGHGLESPGGWLDGAIENVEVGDDELTFDWLMRNDTDEGVVISRCPLIDVELQTEGIERDGKGFRTYVNCLDAPDVIEPGDTFRFAIEAPLEDVGTGEVLEVELRDESRVLYRVVEEVPA